MDKRLEQSLAILIVVIVAMVLVVFIANPSGDSQRKFTYTEEALIQVEYQGYNIMFPVLAERIVGGASELGKTMYFISSGSDESVMRSYYQGLVSEKEQVDLLQQMADGFNKELSEIPETNDDDYVDLVVKYVQSMEYVTMDTLTKYPTETVTEGYGDCDDRSLLLAGILAEAGYDVALLYFDDQAHLAAGIRVDPEYSFQNTGYAFIESTAPAFIGDVPTLENNVSVVNVVPEVIRIGDGTKKYGAMEQNAIIIAVAKDARAELVRLAPLIDVQRERVDRLEERMSYYRGMQNKIDYQIKYDEYRRAAGLLNEYVRLYNYNVDILNYITENAGNRRNVMNYLFSG